MSETVRRLETTGIESEAVDAGLEPAGHVLMLDYDDEPLEAVQSDLETIPGPSVLVHSSPGSWHVYGLALRPFEDAIEEARSTNASSEYVDEMDRRGVFTLRTGAKVDDRGEIEKPVPVPIAVTLTPTEDPIDVSRPHTVRLRQLAEEADVEPATRALRAIETGAVDGLEPVGEKLARSRYETRTEAR